MPIPMIERTGVHRVFTPGTVTKDDSLGVPTVTLSNSGASSAQEFYLVEDLEGGDAIHRLQSALVSPGIPLRGSIHPTLGLPVESIRASFVGENFETQALVEVNYGLVQGAGGFDNDPNDINAQPQIEILTTLQPVLTEFDVNGDTITIDNYQVFPRDANNNIIEGPPELKPPQGGMIEADEEMYTIIARRRERESPGVVKGPTYTNTINNTPIFGDGIDVIYVWKCAIGGTTDDGGDTWNVVYEFQRNHPTTWNTVVVWRDPETGLPGVDVTRPATMVPGATGNGTKVVQHYPATNFRDLQLPIFD